MALTSSTMLALGTIAPPFELFDVISNKPLNLNDIKSDKGTVVMFICNHCPYVQHILAKLVEVAEKYQQHGLQFVAINTNDINRYPDDAPDKMRGLAEKMQFPFPYLFDETQQIAKAYQAACTPDFYLFDQQLRCIYRGRFDDATPGNNNSITGKDLCNAMDNLLAGKTISLEQLPSIGCNIKWKS